MGCICSKGSSADEYVENDERSRKSKKSSKRLVSTSRREEVVVEVDNGGTDATSRLISTETKVEDGASTATGWDGGEKKAEKPTMPSIQGQAANGQPGVSRVFSTPIGIEGGQVAAGWPSWLTAVAGEAINGWIPRRADSYEKLEKIGQGTYSSVYRARDLETGRIVALKKVRFVNMDPESVRFMAREILILRRLEHPNVMKLEGLLTSKVSGNLYLVFEYMEHDLAGLAASPMVKFTEPQIKCYMQQLFNGLDHCHSRGILHRDIKGSNLLIDNKGNLKIADFGLATFYSSNQKQPLTSRVVTLWYRPPELLLGATDYGVAVDLWSAGCILAELFAGKPIMPGRTEVEQLHKIFKLCGSPSEEYWEKSKLPHATIFKPQHTYKRCVAETFKDFPPSVLTLLDALLAIEPACRGTAFSALQSEFFKTNPFPCDPSILPKYPPSKEFDAKVREARRQAAAAGKGRGYESYRKVPRESKAVSKAGANAEAESIQSNQKSKCDKFNPEEDDGSGFPIMLSEETSQISSINININEIEPLMGSRQAVGSSKENAEWRTQITHTQEGAAAQLSMFSNSVSVQGSSRFDLCRERSGMANQLEGSESYAKQEWPHNMPDRPNASCKKDECTHGKESTMVYSPTKNRIHYSGPLLPPDGNLEEMLREHERRIQQAVRKARQDKTKNKKAYIDNGQAGLLLHDGTKGR